MLPLMLFSTRHLCTSPHNHQQEWYCSFLCCYIFWNPCLCWWIIFIVLDGAIRQGNSQNGYFKLKRRMSKLKCKNSRNMFCISSFLYFFVICFGMGYCIHLFVDKFLYVNTDETFQNTKIRNAYKCFIFMYYIQFMTYRFCNWLCLWYSNTDIFGMQNKI